MRNKIESSDSGSRKRTMVFLASIVLTGLQTLARADMNLLVNPGNEMALVGGEIPGWTEVVGSTWTQRGADPAPFEGSCYFFAGANATATLAQVVDVSAFATGIDAGVQAFDFEGYVRSWPQNPADAARILVEYRDAEDGVLNSFDSGNIMSVGVWQLVSDTRMAPVGTRDIYVQLISTRRQGANNDGYFDALSLETHVVPVPAAVLLGGIGLSVAGRRLRRSENR